MMDPPPTKLSCFICGDTVEGRCCRRCRDIRRGPVVGSAGGSMAVVVDNCAVRKHGASCKRFRDISFLGSWRVKERFLFAMMCWEEF